MSVSVSTAIVSVVSISGGISISLRFGISGSFVELRDTISGSRGGNVLVASAGGIVRSESSVSVSIRITISVRVAIGTSVQVCGISFSFGISRPLAKSVVGISVSSVSVRISIVSTIVSSVVKTISVWVAVVSTIVGSGSIGISLGLGSHDGEKGNGENGEIFHVADYQAIG